jgi:SAM-dependent methyltransferase
MGSPPHDRNREIYRLPEVVADFALGQSLETAEQAAFGHLRPSMRILDVGVGAGRTVPVLSGLGGAYHGVDYSEAMVAHCRQQWPALRFDVMDASQPWPFGPASYDAVLFSFNGLDYLHPEAARHRFFGECHRVLAPQGLLIFSSHNPRALLAWHPPRGRRGWAWLRGLVRAALEMAGYALVLLGSRPFWSGDGYFTDPYHGLVTRAATPKRVIAEARDFGFEPREPAPLPVPAGRRGLTAAWYYYVFGKEG